jgi:hypothetical protein
MADTLVTRIGRQTPECRVSRSPKSAPPRDVRIRGLLHREPAGLQYEFEKSRSLLTLKIARRICPALASNCAREQHEPINADSN